MQTVYVVSRHIVLLCLILCCFAAPVQAQAVNQDTTELYRIQTRDGNEYIGTILQQNEEFVQLRTKNLGDITIARVEIERIILIKPTELVDGEVWPENQQATRYFWSPNGYGLRKGEGYYQNVWVFFNQASVGITDNFSLGVGTVPLFLFAGTSSPIWITPKLSVPVVKDKFNLGAGALLGTVLGEEGAGFGILYGVGTVGSRDKNVTVGLGYAFAGGEAADSPVITFSGMLRISKRGYLLTENYFLPVADETLMLLMLGGRTVFSKVSLDYGAVIPANSGAGELFLLPWLGFSLPFGTAAR